MITTLVIFCILWFLVSIIHILVDALNMNNEKSQNEHATMAMKSRNTDHIKPMRQEQHRPIQMRDVPEGSKTKKHPVIDGWDSLPG
ncbi:hypothetical protein QVD17_22305 [Tagetes erecta]|uniref:Secreted protein n=1 Tax=Tagetes erecta TaxID=13708 RepID=A0AAD8KCV3_TARER|nr:hypothetical protein QVD17_22305 [Tagetes erecta]